MTVKVYITRDSITNNEKGFEHDYERLAALQIAKAIWRKYNASKTDYAILVNLTNPPIDLVIISNNGLGVAELKNYNGALKGTDDNEWTTVDAKGQPLIVLKSGSHTNPFQQVKYYRRRMFELMKDFARQNPNRVPEWLLKEFYIQASVIFTGPRVDLSRVKLDPKEYMPWFNFKWLDEVPDWAYSLNFGRNFRLSSGQIDAMLVDFFKVGEWSEIKGNLSSTEVYGCLWLVVDGVETFPLNLDEDEMTIGRDVTNSIMLSSKEYFKVSREHAIVRKTAAGVILMDNGSKHGTWVNGKPLHDVAGHSLKSGDQIVFGPWSDDKPVEGACELMYRAIPRHISATVSE